MRLFLLLSFAISIAPSARSQVHDDFTDHDLARDPAWIGDTLHWTTGSLRGSAALRSNGGSRVDTLSLAVITGVSYGSWRFTFAHRGVNLSTFNGARIFLAAGGPDPSLPLHGYYVQIGTNNTDHVSLWRAGGDLATSRTELGRSPVAVAEGDSSFLSIYVRRTRSEWTVAVHGDTLIRAPDDGRYVDGAYLIYWVKHSPAGASAFFLDDLLVENGSDSEPLPPPVTHRLPDPGEIVINEIQFDPSSTGSEYVELLNLSTDTFDLSAVQVRDERSTPSPLTTGELLLKPGGYALIAQNAPAMLSEFPETSPIVPPKWPALNNSGDLVVIEAGGAVIDSIRYESEWTSDHASVERIDPALPGDRHNFGPSTDPQGGTPGRRNSIYHPDTSGPRVLHAEEIDSLMVELTFDEPVRDLTTEDVFAGSSHPTSLMPSGDLSVVAVFDREVDAPEITIGRLEDRGGNETFGAVATVAFRPRPGELVVNEIMYEPLADPYDGLPDQPEYVEILNVSTRTVTLSGLRKTRQPDERGDADTLFVGADHTAVEPGAYAVLYSGPSLHDAFPGATFATHPVSALALRNEGDRIRILRPDGIIVEDLRYDPGWHHPRLAISRGISLERIDPRGPSSKSDNWTTSVAPGGGTPGRDNSVMTDPDPPASGMSISPTPFSPDRDGHEDVAVISYRLDSERSIVRIRIFDIRGVLVRELVRSELVGFEGTAYWDGLDELGRELRIGIYIVLLEAASQSGRRLAAFKQPVVLARHL